MANKSKSKKKFYAVAAGRAIGVFDTWNECQEQTKGYSRAKFKSFHTKEEAQAFVAENREQVPSDYSSAEPPSKRQRTNSSNGEPQHCTPSPRSTLSIIIHFDGGSRGNPGIAGSGAEVAVTETSSRIGGGEESKRTATKVNQIREYCGAKCTNNVAEYTGLLVGLRSAKDAAEEYVRRIKDGSHEHPCGGDGGGFIIQLSVKGDSNLIICQMIGTNECRSNNLKMLYDKCKSLVRDIENLAKVPGLALSVTVAFDHVYRYDNKAADALANEAMDQRRSWTTTVMRKENGEDCENQHQDSICTAASREEEV